MNAFANVTDAGAHVEPELQSRHPPERESIWHMGNAATRLAGFRHERTERPEGSSRCARLSHRRHSRTPPQFPRVVLRTGAESQGLHPLLQVGKQHVGSLSCQQLPANLGPGARCSGLNASSPSRSSSDRLSHNAIARSARSPGGASTVARVRWIPWRDSLMQHPLRQAGAMVHGLPGFSGVTFL